MSNLLDILSQRLENGGVQDFATQLRTDETATAKALGAAVPAMLAALGRQGSRDGQGLFDTIARDHDGSILDGAAPTYGGHPQAFRGAGTVEHLFGARQRAVAQGVSRASGLSMSKVMQLMVMLAPMVMGAVGKARSKNNVESPGGLGDLLGGVLGRLGEALGGGGGAPGGGAQANPAPPQTFPGNAAPTQSRSGGSIFADLLDRDDDGQIADDVANIGAAVLGKGLLGRLASRA